MSTRLALFVCIALMAIVMRATAQDGPGGSSGAARPAQGGEQVYRQICQACHLADARGSSGAARVPALAGNPRLADASYPISRVLQGGGGMPPLAEALKPEQIAAVVGYVRTHFGNDYPAPVTDADVRALSTEAHD